MFGEALAGAGRPLEGLCTLEDALAAYAGPSDATRSGSAHTVDRAHREFEELRRRKHVPQLPHAAELWDAARSLRALYRSWVDQLARDFATICNEQGYLPPPSRQQRTLFEQVVHPLLSKDGARVAVLLVDALRYEMAAELGERLDTPDTSVHLTARLAELPTITNVGMNALAPVEREGHLTLVPAPGKTVFGGMRCGEFTVRNPATRVRAMAERSVNRKHKPVEIDLGELVDLDGPALKKRIAHVPLVVVHSREIDEAGEANLGLFTFDTWLGQLEAAVGKLRAAGVTEFVLTSDHGFLLQDETTVSCNYNAGRERNRRYALLDAFVDEPDLTGVPLAALGYEGASGYLRLPRDTRVFNASERSAQTFVHGGNSLQERAIPVLTIASRRSPLAGLTRYQIRAEAREPVLGLHRLRVKVEVRAGSNEVMGFATGHVISLGLRVPSRDAQVHVRDAPGAELVNQRVWCPLGGDWVEILFSVAGSARDRVQVEIFHPDGGEDVAPCVVDGYFEVREAQPSAATASAGAASAPAASAPAVDTSWHVRVEDEGHRKVLLHLEAYGTITEEQTMQLLGSARAERRFNNRLAEYRAMLPFAVTVDVGPAGRRYVRGRMTEDSERGW